MSLSKFSAKEMGKKLKAQKQAEAIKKAEIQKKLELEAIELKKQLEKKKREEAERQEMEMRLEIIRSGVLNNLMSECLDAALNGSFNFEIDQYNYEDFYLAQEEYTDFLQAKGFHISEEIVKSSSFRYLEKKIKSFGKEEIYKLRNEIEKIFNRLQKFKVTEVNAEMKNIINQKDNFQFTIDAFYFLSNNLSENFEHDELLEDDLAEDYPEFLNRLKFCAFVDSYESFILEYLPYTSFSKDEEEETYFLSWKAPKEDLINDNWFNARNLNWISSKAGKLFFNDFLKQINDKTEALSDHLFFDSFEKSSNTYLIFDNKLKLRTPIPLIQLIEIFKIFGYKKRIPKADKSGYFKAVKISWKN